MKMIKIVCIKYCILYTLLLNNKNNKEKYVMHLDVIPYDISMPYRIKHLILIF